MLANKNLYNDNELFEDADLNWYDYGFRNYDPQIGRFPQLDPLTWDYPELTNYQYASNEPIANVDMDGLEASPSVINPGTWFNLPQALDPVVISAKLPSAAVGLSSMAGSALSLANVGMQQISRTIQDNTFVKSSPQRVESIGNTLQSATHRDLLVPGQQVMEPITRLGKLLSGQRSYQIDDGTGQFVSVVVDDEGYLTNQMPINAFEVPFVPDRAPLSLVKFFKGAGKATKIGSVKYLGRMEDLKGIPRSQTILDELPNLGSAKANYYQNMSVIRRNLREGVTFKDASWFRSNSELAPTIKWPTRTVGQTFYGAERNLMRNRKLWP
jgi:RHS repeat-associated protein